MSNLSLRRPLDHTQNTRVNNSFTLTRPALSPLTPMQTPRFPPSIRTPALPPMPQSPSRSSVRMMSSPGSNIISPQLLSPQTARSPMLLNPISPISVEPVIVNGQQYNPNMLTPIFKSVRLTDVEVPKKVVKKVVKKAKQQTWGDMKKNYQVPEYSMMSIEQKRMYRVDFHNRFSMIANQCPDLNVIDYTLDESMSLEEIHVAYQKLLDRISTSSSADWYKTLLVLGWLSTEYIVTKWLGLKSGGYAFFQSRNMNKYDRTLMQLGEVDRNKGFSSWSPITQLLLGSLINLVIFVIVQTFMENMPQDKKDSICNAVGSFFTSTGPEQPNLVGSIPGVLQGNMSDIASAGSSAINGGMGGIIGSLLGGFMGGGQQAQSTAEPEKPRAGRRVIAD